MELRHLRYFVAVAEEQNITRAAERLHISQPPLSRQVRDLEGELDVVLFERTAKSLRLTDAGRVFLTEARAVLMRVEEATQTVRAMATGQHGEVNVAYAPSLTVELLPAALREFQQRRPGVRVILHDLSTEAMLDGLREGSLHVALTIRPPKSSLASLVFHELCRYPICLAAHPSHPLARSRAVSLRSVGKERLLGFTLRDYPEYHDWFARLFKPLGEIPRVSEEYDSATSLIAAVETGRGVALVSQSFTCFVGRRLKLRPVKPAPAPFLVGIVSRRESLADATREFVEAAKVSVRALLPRS